MEVANNSNSNEKDIKRCKQVPYTCNIKQFRIAKGWTQSDLGREIGFTSNAINMMEHEKYFPPIESRLKVALALGVDSSAVWIPIKEDRK